VTACGAPETARERLGDDLSSDATKKEKQGQGPECACPHPQNKFGGSVYAAFYCGSLERDCPPAGALLKNTGPAGRPSCGAGYGTPAKQAWRECLGDDLFIQLDRDCLPACAVLKNTRHAGKSSGQCVYTAPKLPGAVYRRPIWRFGRKGKAQAPTPVL